jgi:release factor glutamine methyltransferase
MTTAQAYFEFKNRLKSIYDDREAANISNWVFENVTGLKQWERRLNQNTELTQSQSNQIEKYLLELMHHAPVQYVLNEAWFYKMKFYVNENVLIPRPETEELVEWIINDIQDRNTSNLLTDRSYLMPKFIDIGTGSGCIAVSLKKQITNADITAIDVSEKALSVAKRNAEMLDATIDFLQIDFLREDTWDSLADFDIIVSNPPYIPIREKEILAKNVRDFEPGIALFVEDNNPYIFYEKIAKFAQTHLKENGRIFVEVHEEYANNVKAIFENAGFISRIKKDIYGKERIINAVKPAISYH